MAILLIPKTYKNSSLDILSFIFIMMVIINPKFIYNIGFQFSFLISTFLLLAQPYLKNLTLSKTIITITCLSQFSSVIISAYHFNQFQWIGFLSNIFFVPYYSFILFPSVIFFFIFCHFKHHNYLLNKIMDSLFQYHDRFVTKFLYFNHYKWFIPNLNEYSLLFLIVTCIFLLLIMAYKA
ncbi:ComEC/Rec2 family competence protein [Staphylococcus saccharolyticus]|uniref:ComEC/Rec2 family competence protein n=1 Tax=Staphylococcus saccharolyticus TaxID=33028 RepID=UPI0032DF6195